MKALGVATAGQMACGDQLLGGVGVGVGSVPRHGAVGEEAPNTGLHGLFTAASFGHVIVTTVLEQSSTPAREKVGRRGQEGSRGARLGPARRRRGRGLFERPPRGSRDARANSGETYLPISSCADIRWSPDKRRQGG